MYILLFGNVNLGKKLMLLRFCVSMWRGSSEHTVWIFCERKIDRFVFRYFFIRILFSARREKETISSFLSSIVNAANPCLFGFVYIRRFKCKF